MFLIASIYEITISSSEPGISRDLGYTPVDTMTSSYFLSIKSKVLDGRIFLTGKVENPEDYISTFITPLTDYISIHLESKGIDQSLKSIKENGIKCGLAINPDTEIQKLYPFLEIIDMVIIMSVFPGKGGQTFIENTYDKVETLRNLSLIHI
mgnify:CR=1 FL=1